MFLIYVFLICGLVAAAGMISGFIFLLLAIWNRYRAISSLFETVSMFCFLIMIAAIVIFIVCVGVYGFCEVI